MDTEEIEQNAYAPPETCYLATTEIRNESNRSKPIIPAIIGFFTYGSSSPYALVLCVEQYLSLPRSSIPWSTHVATVLSLFGTMSWIFLNLVYAGAVINSLIGREKSTYASLGLTIWLASTIFLIWMIWRIVLFQRRAASFRNLD